MKFVLFVEGHTESNAIGLFIKRWLDPQLESPVSIMTIRFNGYGELIKDVNKRTLMILNNPKSGDDVIAVISLLDFYGPSFPYPNNINTTHERCLWAKQYIESIVTHGKFKHFFAVHEIEAWLLSSPEIFPSEIRRNIPKQSPETINSDKPPKALLRELYRKHTGHNYKETVDGPNLFARLNPITAYNKCPNLKAMLDEMLKLAQK